MIAVLMAPIPDGFTEQTQKIDPRRFRQARLYQRFTGSDVERERAAAEEFPRNKRHKEFLFGLQFNLQFRFTTLMLYFWV